jgi:ammonium transporter Rh
MEDILNATLAGGVAIGAPSGIFTNLAASLTVGLGAGVISTLGYRYLSEKLEHWFGLHDTCGVHNLHGIPGLIGGIVSAIAVASYASDPVEDGTAIAGLPFYNANGISDSGRTFYEQGGSQIAGTFVSLGLGIFFGCIAGFLMRCVYVYESK